MKKQKGCLNWFVKNIPKVLPDVLALAGAGLLVRGALMIWTPAGWLAAGALCIAGAVIVGRAGGEGG